MTSLELAALANPAAKKFGKFIYDLARANDNAATEEYQQALEDMLVRLHASWVDSQDEERPTLHDVVLAAKQLNDEYTRASSNKKRELLNRAFLGRFNPKLYSDGMTQMLWDYARRLEYPEAALLAEMTTTVQDQIREHSPTTSFYPDTGSGSQVRFTACEVQISKFDIKYELVRRLAGFGLVELREHSTVVNVAPVLGLAEHLREFIWGNFESPSVADESSQET